jgi:hypothetical protein
MSKSELFLNESAIKIRLLINGLPEGEVLVTYKAMKEQLSHTFEIIEPAKFTKKKLWYSVASDEENQLITNFFQQLNLKY